MATWLTWSGVSILVAVLTAIVIGSIFTMYRIEALTLAFGAGMGFSAATPRVLRAIGRRLR
jgi:hypothetical protein